MREGENKENNKERVVGKKGGGGAVKGMVFDSGYVPLLLEMMLIK